jgi:hypothetical protein
MKPASFNKFLWIFKFCVFLGTYSLGEVSEQAAEQANVKKYDPSSHRQEEPYA